jgi:hypothetical protein
MEYYFISFLISLVIFIIIQFIEYFKHLNEIKNNSDNYYIEPYTPFKLNNVFLFIIIYIVFTIGCYYLNPSNLKTLDFIDFNKFIGGNSNNNNKQSQNDIKNDIDPKILSKINDNFKVGFEPFNSDNDNENSSDNSSDNSSEKSSDNSSEKSSDNDE